MLSTTKSIIYNTILRPSYQNCPHYINLPNQRIMSLDVVEARCDQVNEDKKMTFLTVYSNQNLEKSIFGDLIDGEYHFLSILPDHSLLFNHSTYGEDFLVKISSDNFKIISSQLWRKNHSIGVIDATRFFCIEYENNEFYLIIYHWRGNKFIKDDNKILFSTSLKFDWIKDEIYSLSGHRFGCYVHDENTKEYKILIFEIDPNAYMIKECGNIKPDAQHEMGNVTILPNRQLLTYDLSKNTTQVWDPYTFCCIYEWDWGKIKKIKSLPHTLRRILPMPNSVHLLIGDWERLYLFNMKNSTMKHVELNDSLLAHGLHHVLPNGQVLAFMDDSDCYLNHTFFSGCHSFKIKHLDIDDILQARKRADRRENEYILQSFFSSRLLPKEVSDIIFSYAFR